MVIADVALVFSLAAHVHWGWHLLAAALVFGALAWWVRRDLGTVSPPALLMITVAVQATGLLVFPLTSDDIYRYVWDGRVQLAGIDPYRFVPLDPALTFLRDAQLFPPGGPPAINRPGVHTIYPPGAQALFTAVAFLLPASLGLAGLRVVAGAAVVITTVLLGRYLGPRRGLALLYGANPLVMIEAANGGHLDALVALAVLGVVWCTVSSATLVGRAVPRPGGLAQAGAAVARARAAASRSLADQSDRGADHDRRATCRTCWWWARWSWVTCRAIWTRRATTAAAGSRCSAGCRPRCGRWPPSASPPRSPCWPSSDPVATRCR